MQAPPKPVSHRANEHDIYKTASHLLEQLRDFPHLQPFALRIIREVRPCRHSPDFASVRWYGEAYSFTARQSHVVRILWRAWHDDVPDVRVDTLLDAAGISSDEDVKLPDVFKNNPAWGKWIIPGEVKGTYRIKDRSTSMQIPRSFEGGSTEQE